MEMLIESLLLQNKHDVLSHAHAGYASTAAMNNQHNMDNNDDVADGIYHQMHISSVCYLKTALACLLRCLLT